jgi:diguanylate cyclase (GGDEF)-like protein
MLSEWSRRRAWRDAEAMRELARHDQQTGLLHHNAFMTACTLRIAGSGTHVLLVGDIDRFKSINDTCGHQIGDQVIAAVAATVRDLFGKTAVTGRIGGEEFAILMSLPFADASAAHHAALAFAQEWRKRVAEIVVPDMPFTITISAGLARLRSDETLDSLYARADRALYVAKTSGRNRVVADDRGVPDDAEAPWPSDEPTETAEIAWIDPAADAPAVASIESAAAAVPLLSPAGDAAEANGSPAGCAPGDGTDPKDAAAAADPFRLRA